MLPLLTSLALAAPSWSDTAIVVAGRDGHRLPAEARAARLAPHCAEGRPLACTPDLGHPLRPTDLLAASCTPEAPTACLLHAWSLGTDHQGAWRSGPEIDGKEVHRALSLACEAGLPRACTERAWLSHHGIGTYANPTEARAAFTRLCDAKEPAACRALAELTDGATADAALAQAVALGDPPAIRRLASSLPDDQALPLLDSLCTASIPGACLDLARRHTGVPRQIALERACATGDPASCARATLGRRATPLERARALDALATGWPEAATWAALIRAGAQLDPFMVPADLSRIGQTALDKDVHAALAPCYIEQLARLSVEGWVDATLVVDPSGEVQSGAVHAFGFDDDFQACAAVALRDVRPLSPSDHPRLAHARTGLGHTSRLEAAHAGGGEEVAALTAVSKGMNDWGEPLSLCAIGRGFLPEEEARFVLNIDRRGQIPKPPKIIESSGYDEVDACLIDTLQQQTTEATVSGIKIQLTVTLLQARTLPEEKVVYRTEPFPFSGSPTPFRVLLWFVDHATIGGKRVATSDPSEQSVQRAFDDAATWIHEQTGGALDVQITPRRMTHDLQRVFGDGDRGMATWFLHPIDLPDEALRTVERGHFDAVYVVGPIPRGAPQPYGALLWTDELLAGATFASLTLSEGRELRMPDGTDASVFALALLYDSLAQNARDRLAVTLPPNDQPLRLANGRSLGPRIGFDDKPIDFYAHVFTNTLQPALWADLAAEKAALQRMSPGNLAFTADPIASEGVRGRRSLNDGLSRAPGVVDHATAPEAEGSRNLWFGLSWPTSVPLGSVAGELDADVTAVKVLVHQGARWVAVAEAPVDAQGAFAATFPATEGDGLRIELQAAGPVAVMEIEAFAP